MGSGGKHSKKATRGTLTSAQKSLFVAGTQITGASGRLNAPFREMTIGQDIKPGRHATKYVSANRKIWFTDSRQMELPRDYKGIGATGRNGVRFTREKWKATYKTDFIEMSSKQLHRHLVSVAHQIPIATEHWRLVLAHRALKVFQESFKLKRFNSAGSARWKLNTEWTRKKRKWKGTWPGAGKLMQETNALFKSLHVVNQLSFIGVNASARYAGIHNNPSPGMTYGNGFGGKYFPPKPVTQRQFMGHSTEIDEFIASYERRYLFDTIFRKPV